MLCRQTFCQTCCPGIWLQPHRELETCSPRDEKRGLGSEGEALAGQELNLSRKEYRKLEEVKAKVEDQLRDARSKIDEQRIDIVKVWPTKDTCSAFVAGGWEAYVAPCLLRQLLRSEEIVPCPGNGRS